jgi:hypothetical protein
LHRYTGLAHNSTVTDDATDGRPWPIDPAAHDPVPIPELGGTDDVTTGLAGFVSPRKGSAPAVAAEPTPVSDEDRTRFGVLLDHAAERGLLSSYDYELRLGELADATSIEQMREIVTQLPAFTSTPTSARRSVRATGTSTAPATGERRRANPWLLLGMLVVVIVAALVFFSIYAEHVVGHHHVGMRSTGALVRALSVLRL